MMKSAIFFTLIWATSALQALQSASTGTVQGTVLRSDKNDPIADAQVSVITGTAATSTPPALTVFTDGAGRFVINNVPPGRWPVNALRQGYFAVSILGISSRIATTTVTVTAGQATEVRLLMTPGGALSGKVIDPSGQAITDTQVQALRLRYQNGVLAPELMGYATTNDRGEYRIFRLPPAEYFIAAIPGRPANPASEIPMGTFYPNVEDVAGAASIALRGGDDLSGFDIRVRSAAGGKLSGKVISALPPGPAVRPFSTSVGPAGEIRPSIAEISLVRRQSGIASVEMPASVRASEDGSFEIRNVLPGSYELIARLPVTIGWGDANPPPLAAAAFAFGRASVTVPGNSADNIFVTVNPGTDVRGTVLVDGRPTPSAVRISLEAQDVAARGSVLTSVLSQVASFEPEIKQDGSFMIPMVPDAHYRFVIDPSRPPLVITKGATQEQASVRARQEGLRVLPADTYVADIRQGGVSIYDTGLITGTAAGQAPIEVLLNTDAGSLNGSVIRKDQTPAAGATVVLVPEMGRRQNPALYKVGRSDAQGRFTLNQLPPGAYKVFAWESVLLGAYQNAGFLERVEQRGVVVNITAGSRTNTSVGLIANED